MDISILKKIHILERKYRNDRTKTSPFCGGEAKLYVNDGVRVICNNCNCQTPILRDSEYSTGSGGTAVSRVIKKWNSRVNENVD